MRRRRLAPAVIALFAVGLGVLGGLGLRGFFSGSGGVESRSVRIVVLTDAAEVTVFGERERDCLQVARLGKCAPVTRSALSEGKPVRAELSGVVSPGVSLLYWGCDEGAAVPRCTVGGDRPDALVCISTSSLQDSEAGQACAELAGSAARPRTAGTGTQTVVVVPVTPDGKPRPEYTVTDLSEKPLLDSCSAAYSAVAPDIVSCSPSAMSAHACWVGADRVTLLCGSAGAAQLYRHRVSRPLPPVEPLPEDRRWPLAIELMDGTKCTRRWGGPAPLLPGNLVAPYVCGAHGLLVHPAPEPFLDRREPFWTVRTTGSGVPAEGDPLPPPQRVASVYYAGR